MPVEKLAAFLVSDKLDAISKLLKSSEVPVDSVLIICVEGAENANSLIKTLRPFGTFTKEKMSTFMGGTSADLWLGEHGEFFRVRLLADLGKHMTEAFESITTDKLG